jgi:NAD(P)-dependent dehydrogenase (short-subunit alcohol dehydrogenase family)
MPDPTGAGRVSGRVAIVTGGASGLGLACAQLLSAEGATVVIADTDEDAGRRAARSMGPPSWTHSTDVSDETSVAALFEAVRRRHGRLDILVTCAAVTDPAHQAADQAVADLEMPVWERTLAVDLGGTMLCCKHAVPLLLSGGGPHESPDITADKSIVTITSNSAFGGDLGLTAYSSAKAGVVALTRSVAAAYGKNGIRVNAVSPGSIRSPSLMRNVPDAVAAMLADNCLLPRMGTAQDIASAVLFLASAESSFITGQVLRVDGGTSSQLVHVPGMRRAGLRTTGVGASAFGVAEKGVSA